MNREERDAIRREARRRLREIERVREYLKPDADDPLVAAELADLSAEKRAALAALNERSVT